MLSPSYLLCPFSQLPVKEILKEEGNTAKNEHHGQRTYTFFRTYFLST